MSSHARPVVAIVAAAGKGTRLGAELPKAYVELRGRSLVERSVDAMITSQVIDEVIVVIDPTMEEYATKVLSTQLQAEIPVRLVHGSVERADSVWCGLQAINHEQAVVLVHDAARALTPERPLGWNRFGQAWRGDAADYEGQPPWIVRRGRTDTRHRPVGNARRCYRGFAPS